MSKTALNYALETIKEYQEISILNPDNMPGGVKLASQYEKWIEQLDRMSIHIKLDTILERLPYERNTNE